MMERKRNKRGRRERYVRKIRGIGSKDRKK